MQKKKKKSKYTDTDIEWPSMEKDASSSQIYQQGVYWLNLWYEFGGGAISLADQWETGRIFRKHA